MVLIHGQHTGCKPNKFVPVPKTLIIKDFVELIEALHELENEFRFVQFSYTPCVVSSLKHIHNNTIRNFCFYLVFDNRLKY